jgi:uncharacterized protein (DUF1684 family)
MRPLLIALVALLTMNAASDVPQTYRDEIVAWRKTRDQRLRSPDGWLALVGLFWLHQGQNTIGAGGSNDFALPPGSVPERTAKITVTGEHVLLTNLAGERLKVNGAEVSAPVDLSYDEDKPDKVTVDRISFFVIKRGERLAIRAKDRESPVLMHFTGMKYFPINPAYRVEANFLPDKKMVQVPNILRETELTESPGVVEFKLAGNEYRLRPVYEDDTLFFVFKDETSQRETYQAGRMLNTPLPKDGKVVLDFNRAYNPPCTFTPYATCPLPMKENQLPVRIEAGELRYGHGHPE